MLRKHRLFYENEATGSCNPEATAVSIRSETRPRLLVSTPVKWMPHTLLTDTHDAIDPRTAAEKVNGCKAKLIYRESQQKYYFCLLPNYNCLHLIG